MLNALEAAWLDKHIRSIESQRAFANLLWEEICFQQQGLDYYDTRTSRVWADGTCATVQFCGPGSPVLYWITHSKNGVARTWRSDTNDWLD